MWYHRLRYDTEDPSGVPDLSQEADVAVGGKAVRTRSRKTLSVAVAASIAFALIRPAVAGATPTTPEIEEKQAELAEAQAALDRMADDLSLQVEEYNAISEALAETREEIAVVERDLSAARDEVDRAEEVLSDRATEIYKSGPAGLLEVLIGTRTFEEFLVRLDWVRRLSSQDADLADRVKDARDRVEELRRTLEARESEQIVLRDEAKSQKLRIEASIERQESYVASLGDDIKRLIAEEEERQRRLAEERARRAAEKAARARAAAEAAAAAQSDSDPDIPTPGSSGGAGRPEVVEIGLRYLGVPYAWGGTSPETGFDCSGLTQYAYREIGIDIPRTSRSQFRAGTRIVEERLDLLELGDLVFFGYEGDPGRVHHVGIYVGDENFLHAPQTGDVVRVSSLLERIAEKDDYVGASRF